MISMTQDEKQNFTTAIVAAYEKELDAIPKALLSKKTRGDLIAGFQDGVRNTLAQIEAISRRDETDLARRSEA